MKFLRAFRNSSRAALLLPIVIIAIIAFAVYSNTLVNEFVYDDSAQVGKNPWIRDIRYLPDIFTSSVWGFESGPVTSNYYRPMMNVMFMLAYHIFGLKAWGFHLFNILFHVGNSVLVFIIAARLPLKAANNEKLEARRSVPPVAGKSRVVDYSLFTSYNSLFFPFIAALLFAAHPIHVESVAWVSALPEISFSLFCLLSLYFYIRGDSGFDRAYLLSVLFFFVAVFCKETAVTLLALLVAYDFTFRKDQRLGELWKRYIPYIVITGVYLGIRTYALGGFAPAKRFTNLSAFEYIINVFPLFAQYLEKLLLPVDLNAFYVFHPISSVVEPKFIFGLAVTAVFIAFARVSWKKSPVVFLSLVILAAPLLPVLYIPNLGENAFTERYAYLPSFGFVLIVALFLDLLRRKRTGLSMVIVLATVFLAGAYTFQTVTRNAVWRNPFVFFTDMAEKSPESAMAQSSLGLVLFQQDRTEEAIAHYMEAIRLDPSYAGSYNNLGVIYSDRGWMDKAVQMFQTSLRISPDNAEALTNLGLAYKKMGLLDKAIEQYEKAAQLRPNFVGVYNNLGLAYAELGWLDKAIDEYRTALKLNPEFAEAHGNLGAVYSKKGLTELAIAEFTKMVSLDPARGDAHYNLGLALYNGGLKEKAVRELEIAAQLQPGDARLCSILGTLYAELGSMDKAIGYFKEAVRLAPDEPDYRRNLDSVVTMKTSAPGTEK
jgi:tetratricopeptide (TPR) repeat protein